MSSKDFQDIISNVGNMNTIVVGDYFKSRGFEIKKLDTNQDSNSPKNCDWLVQGRGTKFLCEVKTIQSVQRGTETQDVFRKKFENRVQDYFSRRKDIQNLPYHLCFHSDTLSIPQEETFIDCLKSISQMLLYIHSQEEKQIQWEFGCRKGAFDLSVTQSWSGSLEVIVSSYGGLNLRRVENSLSDAIEQLRRSGEDYSGIARLVVLAFVNSIYITPTSEVVIFSGRQIKDVELWRLIDRILKRNKNLSAIAVMQGQYTRFGVYHNPALIQVKPLEKSVFDDGVSVQVDSIDSMPRRPDKPLDWPELLRESPLEAALRKEQKAITLADYKALKEERS